MWPIVLKGGVGGSSMRVFSSGTRVRAGEGAAGPAGAAGAWGGGGGGGGGVRAAARRGYCPPTAGVRRPAEAGGEEAGGWGVQTSSG